MSNLFMTVALESMIGLYHTKLGIGIPIMLPTELPAQIICRYAFNRHALISDFALHWALG